MAREATPEASLEPRRIYIDTYGCQMNVHDSERMIALMAAEGYASTDRPEDADLIVLNSCNVREKAENKLRSRAGQLRELKKLRPGLVLAIGGCVAETEHRSLMTRLPFVDVVFGPDHIGELPELVARAQQHHRRQARTGFLKREDYRFPSLGAPGEAAPISSYVSIMKGCDKYCSYCVVPHTRGPEVSRDSAEILAEVQTLVERGAKEIILLGQTVNSYGRRRQDGQIPFAELLYQVAAIPGVERLRFTSPHPAEFSDAQIRAFKEIPELCPHMHLPVQSGSSRVLAAMRRGYTREAYLEVVDRLKAVASNVALSTDIIVGFPGETEADFEATLSLMEQVGFQTAFSFAYSERSGTPAVDLPEAVPVPERFARLQRLQALQNQITQTLLAAMVGQEETVMIEGPSKTDPGRSTGRTGQNRPVHVEGHFDSGVVLNVTIVEAYKHSLLAKVS